MESGERTDYRPVSPLAVAAFGAGVLSALALVSPICWVIPLVAVGLAVAALGDVNRPGAAKAGGLAAVAGLALAVGFGAQAVTSAVVSRWLVERRAADTARHWLDAVRTGRLADAMSVCAPRALPGGGGRHDHPGGPPQPAATDAAAAFAALPVVQAVAGCGAEPPRIGSIAAAEGTEGGWGVVAALAACGRPDERVRLVVEPMPVEGRREAAERWLVTGFTLER